MRIFFAGRTGFATREKLVIESGVRRRLLSYDQNDILTVSLPEWEKVRQEQTKDTKKRKR